MMVPALFTDGLDSRAAQQRI
jgi:hypothetical protein